MPQAPVPTDSTESTVYAGAAAFATAREGAGGARAAAATACPPRLRRVVAFMSANQAVPRVDDALAGENVRAEVADA